MRRDQDALRAERQALRTLIQKAVKQLSKREGADPADTLLFLGNRHQAIPALVVQDPVLEPVDKLVWMVIQLQAQATGGRTAFPCYDQIAQTANIGSTSTISRAIAILRITRWLTLCARVRNTQGQFCGNVYALHDEPLPLKDALTLDTDYMTFIHRATQHHHARVCRVAQGVLLSMDEVIKTGSDLTRSIPLMEQRAQRAEFPENTQSTPYFAFTAGALKQLNNRTSNEGDRQDQNSKEVEEGIPSSCCDLKNTTTTKLNNEKPSVQAKIRSTNVSLIYPTRLSENQRLLAARYLEPVDAELRQPLLDELQGRLAAENNGMTPLYDPLRFLHALCHAAHSGTFIANLGLPIKEARERQHKSFAAEKDTRQLSLLNESPGSAKSSITPLGEAQLSQLRQKVGLSTGKARLTDHKAKNEGC